MQHRFMAIGATALFLMFLGLKAAGVARLRETLTRGGETRATSGS